MGKYNIMDSVLSFIARMLLVSILIMLSNFTLMAQETVTDIDGNVYQTITIGTQVWMKENLKNTHYRNGDAIPNVTDADEWVGLNTGAYCNYNNDSNVVATHGRLYNWYAVVDSRNPCPQGWHLPSDAEWDTLINYLGGPSVAGGKLKETGTVHWLSPNSGATNESGFTALPSGGRTYTDGAFDFLGTYGGWWCSNEQDATHGYFRNVNNNDNTVGQLSVPKEFGVSIRCLKDVATGVDDSKNKDRIPSGIKLNQNYPNPFNPSTNICYSLKEPGNVKLEIFDLLGKRVKILVNEYQAAGDYTVAWEGKDNSDNALSSGVYFYSLFINKNTLCRKMILLR